MYIFNEKILELFTLRYSVAPQAAESNNAVLWIIRILFFVSNLLRRLQSLYEIVFSQHLSRIMANKSGCFISYQDTCHILLLLGVQQLHLQNHSRLLRASNASLPCHVEHDRHVCLWCYLFIYSPFVYAI